LGFLTGSKDKKNVRLKFFWERVLEKIVPAKTYKDVKYVKFEFKIKLWQLLK